jgi:Arc/MetJ-type ribon-helix-helix transcriptional regulator
MGLAELTRMAKEDQKLGQPFTVRLPEAQDVWVREWTRSSGQPASLVVRAAVALLITLIDAQGFEERVRLVADLGASANPMESAIGAELARKLIGGSPKPKGRQKGQQSA